MQAGLPEPTQPSPPHSRPSAYRSWVGEPTPQRGGRRRKFYALRPAGDAALRQAYRAFTAMAGGFETRLESK